MGMDMQDEKSDFGLQEIECSPAFLISDNSLSINLPCKSNTSILTWLAFSIIYLMVIEGLNGLG